MFIWGMTIHGLYVKAKTFPNNDLYVNLSLPRRTVNSDAHVERFIYLIRRTPPSCRCAEGARTLPEARARSGAHHIKPK